MKKLLVLFLMLSSTGSFAHEGLRHGGYYRGNNWVAPMIIGGVIGYELSRPHTPPPVVYGPPPVVYSPPPAPYGYHYENILDANCNCYRTVLAPN